MRLNNMLIYAFTRTVTCGSGPFTDDQYQIVTVILDGLCNSFAGDSAICSEIDPSTITCNVFEESYINLILRIIKDIQDKMAENSKFTDLENKLDVVKRLIECSSTSYITDGNGNEVHSTSGSIAVIKVGTLTQNYKAQLAHTSSSNRRRNLSSESNICSVQFDQIPSNLQSQSNLVIKMEYDTSCANNNKVCDSTNILTTTPKCCRISIVSASTDFSGATKIVRNDVTSSENGRATLGVPTSSCTSDSKCIYFDETNKCWSTSGVTTNSNCAGCVTDHFSIFSMSSISSSVPNRISEIAEDEVMAFYENIILYIFVILDLFMICLFCRTLRSRNIKVYAISSTNQIKVRGYTKTVQVEDERPKRPQLGEVVQQTNPVLPSQNIINKVYGIEEDKVEEEVKGKEEQSFDQVNLDIDNQYKRDEVLKCQENETLKESYCKSYCKTILKKHRIISPICYEHPNMSHFSRGILLNISLSIAFIAPVICMVALSSMAGMVASIILSFAIMRALSIPLESLLFKRHKKTLNKIQIGLMLVILCIQILVIVIGSWIDKDNSGDLSLSVLIFLLIEFILYELFIHIFHVKLARNLVKNPSKLAKNRFSSKYFMNPIVYDSINDS